MEFRLLYEGALLPSSNSKRRPSEKHFIRRAFHPQLRRLWEVKPLLRELADRRGFLRSEEIYHHSNVVRTPDERFQIGIRTLGKEWSKAGFDLVPLVLPEFELHCSLDVLLLRPEEERFVFTQGDLDGQVKTLLDALRIPDNPEETGHASPEDDEHPLFCLLQNDRLISEIKVTSDQLLMLPREKAVKANDCFVVIHVRLNHRNARAFDNYFG
jgi:hypothetical protein